MITAQVEPLSPALESEASGLMDEHYEELALNKDKVPLSPQWGVYYRLQAHGELMIVTLRKDGGLIGYFVGKIAPGAHYSTCLTLIMDIFYVKPAERGHRGGVKLMQAAEKEAKRRGVQRWFMGHKKHHEDAGRLYSLMGFEPVETYYSKWIGE